MSPRLSATVKLESDVYPPLSQARKDTAYYLRSTTRELADMAGGARFPAVQWLLQMAYIEINDILRGARPADGKSPPSVD